MGRQGLSVRVAGLGVLPRGARKAPLFKAVVRRAFAREKPRARGEVAVVFVTGARMRALNRQFLGHDFDTDVLSFKHENPIPGEAASPPYGDVYVSGAMCRRQAAEQGHSVLREALILAAHGALHLLGHDDRAPRARTRMFRAQDALVDGLGVR